MHTTLSAFEGTDLQPIRGGGESRAIEVIPHRGSDFSPRMCVHFVINFRNCVEVEILMIHIEISIRNPYLCVRTY